MAESIMQIERVPVESLLYDPSNARKHDQKNIDAIKGSLAKFGQQKPIVVTTENVVIAGNGTLQAAKEIGWNDIDVYRTPLKGAEAIAFALADNQTGALAEWDDDILKTQLESLSADGWDVGDIGFDISDLDLSGEGTEGKTDPDEVPDVDQNKFKVERGQVWLLGDHRLMCGDSTVQQDVEKLMGGAKADMVFTDPPYGISLDASNRKTSGKVTDSKGKIIRKNLKVNNFDPIIGDDQEFDPTTILSIPCKEMFLWGANNYTRQLPRGGWVCWDRKLTESGDKSLSSDFELCWSRDMHKFAMCRITWHGVFGHTPDDGGKKVHPSQKPVKLAEWFFERWGKKLTNVLDLFLGSGSTLIACEKTNRKCYGMEIDPHYCSVIIERWQNFTGKEATRG